MPTVAPPTSHHDRLGAACNLGIGLQSEGRQRSACTGAFLRGSGERVGYALILEEWLDARRAGTTPQPAVLDLEIGAAGAQTGNTALCPRSCPRNLGITACPASIASLHTSERRRQAVYVPIRTGNSPVGPGFLLDAG